MGERVLDIGCGPNKVAGAIGMDRIASPGVDIVADLDGAWPVESSSFDEIVARHVLEHVADLVHVMDEAWRVLVPGGTMSITGPHFSSPALIWCDPTHRRGLSLSMFSYFAKDSKLRYGKASFLIEAARLTCSRARPDPLARWWLKPVQRVAAAYEQFINRNPESLGRGERFYSRALPFEEVHVRLKCVKP